MIKFLHKLLKKDLPYYKGKSYPYFDGIKFTQKTINIPKKIEINNLDIIKKILGFKSSKLVWQKWNKEDLKKISLTIAKPEQNIKSGFKIYVINHSSVLLQSKDLNIITDPIYAKVAGPFGLIGPKRVHKPAIALEDLPKIDIILLSHSHYDHMDLKSLNFLRKKFNPIIITPLGNDYILKKYNKNFKVHTLAINEQIKIKDAKITLTPSYHWSRRSLYDRNKALWGGFVIEKDNLKIYYSGDTAFQDAEIFKQLAEKFSYFDLSLLPIGAYLPRKIMQTSHTSPYEAVKIHKLINSKKSIGIHFGTFQLSAESYFQPIIDLEKAKKDLNIAKDAFITMHFGDYLTINNK